MYTKISNFSVKYLVYVILFDICRGKGSLYEWQTFNCVFLGVHNFKTLLNRSEDSKIKLKYCAWDSVTYFFLVCTFAIREIKRYIKIIVLYTEAVGQGSAMCENM